MQSISMHVSDLSGSVMPPDGNVVLNIAVCVLPDLVGICGMPVTNSFHGIGTVWGKGIHHDTSCVVVSDLFTRVA